jgi:hypothetical protein
MSTGGLVSVPSFPRFSVLDAGLVNNLNGESEAGFASLVHKTSNDSNSTVGIVSGGFKVGQGVMSGTVGFGGNAVDNYPGIGSRTNLGPGGDAGTSDGISHIVNIGYTAPEFNIVNSRALASVTLGIDPTVRFQSNRPPLEVASKTGQRELSFAYANAGSAVLRTQLDVDLGKKGTDFLTIGAGARHNEGVVNANAVKTDFSGDPRVDPRKFTYYDEWGAFFDAKKAGAIFNGGETYSETSSGIISDVSSRGVMADATYEHIFQPQSSMPLSVFVKANVGRDVVSMHNTSVITISSKDEVVSANNPNGPTWKKINRTESRQSTPVEDFKQNLNTGSLTLGGTVLAKKQRVSLTVGAQVVDNDLNNGANKVEVLPFARASYTF